MSTSILGYIAERSRQGTTAWWTRWSEVIAELGEATDQKALAPESEDHDEEIRQVIFKTRRGLPYRALFTFPRRPAAPRDRNLRHSATADL